MAMTFPLGLASFADLFPVSSGTFYLSENRTSSSSADGQIISEQRGARKWMGEISFVANTHAEVGKLDALLDMLNAPDASVLMYDHRRLYPLYDPTGSIVGATVQTIASVLANNKEITISGFSMDYALTRGDYFSFSYVDAAGVTQWSLHRIVSAYTTIVGGVTSPAVEFRPHLPRGVSLVGRTITFKKPVCRVVVVPNTLRQSQGMPGMVSEGASFRFMQTTRA